MFNKNKNIEDLFFPRPTKEDVYDLICEVIDAGVRSNVPKTKRQRLYYTGKEAILTNNINLMKKLH